MEFWLKQFKSAAIAATGVAATLLLERFSGLDFGDFTPHVVGAMSVLVNMIKTKLGV